MHPITLQKIYTVYWSGSTTGIRSLREISTYSKIRESLLRSEGVGKLLSNQQDGRYISATELEINRFWPLPFGELVWHLSTQVNYSDLAA